MKKIIVLVMAAVMILGLAACKKEEASVATDSATTAESKETTEATTAPEAAATQAPEQTDSGEAKVAYFVGIMSGGAAWGQAQAGFETACKDLGWEGYYVAPTTPNDTVQMVQLTETALTNGADAIIGTFYSTDIFGDVCSRAKEAGTHIATTNCFMSEDLQDFWIGTDPVGMGITQAKTLAELAGDQEVCVVYMQTQASTETQNQQFAAFSEYLADYKNITIWGQEFCNSDSIKAADTVNALVKANPQINAVVCADGNGCLGVANYVDEQGIADKFISIGIDDSAEILNYVVDGSLDCTIAQDFYAMGYQSLVMLNDILNGTNTYDFNNDSGSVVIYPDAVSDYAKDKGIDM